LDEFQECAFFFESDHSIHVMDQVPPKKEWIQSVRCPPVRSASPSKTIRNLSTPPLSFCREMTGIDVQTRSLGRIVSNVFPSIPHHLSETAIRFFVRKFPRGQSDKKKANCCKHLLPVQPWQPWQLRVCVQGIQRHVVVIMSCSSRHARHILSVSPLRAAFSAIVNLGRPIACKGI